MNTQTTDAGAIAPAKSVFHGNINRVQLTVFDKSTWKPSAFLPNPNPGNVPPVFTVDALSQERPRSTAFSRGTRLYKGLDFCAAWRCIKRAIGQEIDIPAHLSRYRQSVNAQAEGSAEEVEGAK